MKDRWKEVEDLAARYILDVSHSKQVSKIAEAIFDNTKNLHHFGEKEKDLLICAGLLHDIGWCDGQAKHHKRSHDFILLNPIKGFSEREMRMIANIARYHRKRLPSIKHNSFAMLSPADRKTVMRLAAILRIADGMDVTHQSNSKVKSCELDGDTLIIEVSAPRDWFYEEIAAKKKSDLFQEAFGKKVSFRVIIKQ